MMGVDMIVFEANECERLTDALLSVRFQSGDESTDLERRFSGLIYETAPPDLSLTRCLKHKYGTLPKDLETA